MPAAQEMPTGFVTTTRQLPVDPKLLPPSDDASITLSPANLAEYEQTWRLNACEWKGFLSEPSYLDRELFLINSEHTRSGAATAWVLTSSKLCVTEDGSRPILAACETTRKTAYIAKNGKLEQVVSHGIGSVFCRSEYRGRRYADKMMKELGKQLETWQQPKGGKGRFSVLYSDIGSKFYAKNGWKAFPSTHITLKPIDNASEYQQRKAKITPLPQLEDLQVQDLAGLSLVDNLESKLKAKSAAQPDRFFVAFRPDAAQFQWHFMREEFLAEILGREAPQVKGAIDRKTGIALIWTRTYSAEKSGWHLSILHVHIPQRLSVAPNELQKSLSALLLRAQYEAGIWDLAAGVEVWDPQEDVVQAANAIAHGDEIRVISRDQEHICSLKWDGAPRDDVVWLANERFAWC